MKANRRILFLVPYPLNSAPSQRFRFEQYFHHLESNGFHYSVQSFFNTHNWQLFFQKGNAFRKGAILLAGFMKRVVGAFNAIRYDFIFIHREATPIGPPIFEWFIANVLRKRIIYDFDDAIWSTDRTSEAFLMRVSKWRSKVGSICRWSHKVSCGNEYLQQYASHHNSKAFVNPTTIDTDHQHKYDRNHLTGASDRITIGWTGSHSTLKYLKQLENILTKVLLENAHVSFSVIADRKPDLSFSFQFIPWQLKTEIEDLANFDIGIMPLPDDDWSKGKCGFKILQYMALKIPAVASPVGVNTQIISDGLNGFLCRNESDWLEKLTVLINEPNSRIKLGSAGYEQVVNHYSVRSNALNFLTLFT